MHTPVQELEPAIRYEEQRSVAALALVGNTLSRLTRYTAVAVTALAALTACGESGSAEPSMPTSSATEVAPSPVSTSEATAAATATETKYAQSNPEFSTKTTWEQDFSKLPDGPIDEANWRYELNPAVPTYNNEEQAYTDRPENVRIEGGKLLITAKRQTTPYTYPDGDKEYGFTSGRIDTKERMTFEEGKIEVTATLPKGKGGWPAIWLLSANNPFTGAFNPTDADWAKDGFYLHDGEVDIMEAYGDKPGVEGTLHTYDQPNQGRNFNVNNTDGQEHTYGIEVSKGKLVWTIDGVEVRTIDKPEDATTDNWPIGNGNEWYLILNLAMSSELAGRPEASQNEWTMSIGSVRFFDKAA